MWWDSIKVRRFQHGRASVQDTLKYVNTDPILADLPLQSFGAYRLAHKMVQRVFEMIRLEFLPH